MQCLIFEYVCAQIISKSNMALIGTNIKQLRQQQNLSQEALAEALGITRSKISAYEEGRAEPNIDTLVLLSNHFFVATDVLLKADLRKSKPESIAKVGENRLLLPVYVNQDDEDMIEVVPVKASAGYLNGYADPQYFEHFQKMNLPFVPTGKHRAFPIKGDSMLPLCNGDFVVGKFIESVNHLRNGHTYVLVTKDEGLVYKRVYRSEDNPNTLILHSDNKQYSPYTVQTDAVLEIWEYTCAINLSEHRPEDLNVGSIMNMLRSMKVELESLKQQRH